MLEAKSEPAVVTYGPKLLVYVSTSDDMSVRSKPSFGLPDVGNVSYYIGGIGTDTSHMKEDWGTSSIKSARFDLLTSKSYSSRLAAALSSKDVDSLATGSGSGSAELLVLRDMWALVRADCVLVDADSVGRARLGAELVYASLLGLTVTAVTESFVQDPWLFYHADLTIKPAFVGDFLRSLGI